MALAIFIGMGSNSANALSLGRVHVLSALGEPLQAEIDILDMRATEANTLSTKIADPEAFKVAGLDYNPAMPSLQLKILKRADGRSYIQLTGRQAINEPFIDLILEARWSSGRIMRDYTLLFDPPHLRAQAAQLVVPKQLAPTTVPAGTSTKPLVSKASASAPAMPAKLAPANAANTRTSNPATRSTVRIKSGDTAGKLAMQTKSADVSLEQMLIALLRANPDAFIDGNINLIKAGALVKLPTQAEAQKTSTQEARRLIKAQSKDFNQFRQVLASNAPATRLEQTERSAQGKVEAKVQDKKATASANDKLTLTQATVQGKSAEDQIAQANNRLEASQKADALSKTVSDLDKLASASSASPAATTPSSDKSPGVAIPMAPSPAAKSPEPVASPQPSLTDDLLANPLLPAGAAGLLALLAGWGFYRTRQRKQPYQIDSMLHEVRLEDDSFFGNSKKESEDSQDNPATGSSMFYSPSQLDAVDATDPTEEAAVYMAYGRDQQAEEILNEALRDNPERLSIHRKLLEIYSKRMDTQSFQKIALMAQAVTQGAGEDWEGVCKLGKNIDPDNALYQAGLSVPPQAAQADDSAEPDFPTFEAPTVDSEPDAVQSTSATADLDFDLGSPEPEATTTSSLIDDQTYGDVALPDNSWIDETPTPTSTPVLDELDSASDEEAATTTNDLDFPLDGFETEQSPEPAPAAKAAEKSNDNNLVEFDLGDLSLDLDEPAAADLEPDSLEAKLARAEELEAQGDHEGARALIQEVISNASGEVKTKAKDTLDKL